VTYWPGSREARVTNRPHWLGVTAIGMWGYMPVWMTGVLVYFFEYLVLIWSKILQYFIAY